MEPFHGLLTVMFLINAVRSPAPSANKSILLIENESVKKIWMKMIVSLHVVLFIELQMILIFLFTSPWWNMKKVDPPVVSTAFFLVLDNYSHCVYSEWKLKHVIYGRANYLIGTKCKSTLADSVMYSMNWNISHCSATGIHLGDKVETYWKTNKPFKYIQQSASHLVLSDGVNHA